VAKIETPVAETTVLDSVRKAVAMAQDDADIAVVVDDSGTGKTTALRAYIAENRSAILIEITRRSGANAVYHQLCNYLTLAGTALTPTIHWNNIHGMNVEDTKQDREDVYTMKCVGRNMAWLLKVLAAGKKAAPLS
jgi:ABC-type ATPase with predicted acetyltransferase domain